MGKSLKEIVDEGFSRLAVLGERRAEVLNKVERILSKEEELPSHKASLQKLKDAEARFITEIRQQADQLLEDVRQTTLQVTDNDLLFRGSIKENLRLRINGILSEMEESKDYILAGALERRNSALILLDKDFAAGKAEYDAEATRLLAELDFICKRSQSSLRQTQAENGSKLSLTAQELSGLLSETFSSILKDADRARHEARARLNNMFAAQFKQLSAASTEIGDNVSAALNDKLNSVKNSCLEKERILSAERDKQLSEAIMHLEELRKDSLSELEDSCDYSRQELNEKLMELHELTENLIQQEKQSLQEIGNGAKNSVRFICADLTAFPAARGGGIDAALGDLHAALDDCSADLKKKLAVLFKAQLEAMDNLCKLTDKALHASFEDYRAQLKEMIETQDQLCRLKEEDVMSKIVRLEDKIADTYLVLGNGHNGNGGKRS